MKSVTVAELFKNVDRISAEPVFGAEFMKERIITSSRVQRPGLALAGYFDHIRAARVELFGETELNYMKVLEPSRRQENLMKLAKMNRCVFVVSKEMTVPPEILTAAVQHSLPVILAKEATVNINNAIESYLDINLALETTIHGVCVEIYGLGIVITGKSGIGKSECALELIKRGHKLVADDIITVKRMRDIVVGSCEELLHNHIELRGVGILDISKMFGLPSVRYSKKIDLVVDFMDYNDWAADSEADRLGVMNRTVEYLGVSVPYTVCPVSPGRNMAEIVELVAKNQIIKSMGFDSTMVFNKNINDEISKERLKG